MDDVTAVSALAALGQATRLTALRLLLQNAPDGLAAGELAARIGVPQNTMSNHLAVLSNAGLVASTRQAQSIIYRAHLQNFDELIEFLRDAPLHPSAQ